MKINCKNCLKGFCHSCLDPDQCLCSDVRHNQPPEIEQAANKALSQISIQDLRDSIRFDIDKEKTIDCDKQEFERKTFGFDAYEEKNTSQAFAKDFVSDIMLPAHLYNGKDSCGKWKLIGCLDSEAHHNGEGYVRKTIQHCNNKGCKICATATIKREAKAITDRLMAFCNLKRNRKIYLKENRSRILLHVITSVPHEEQHLFTTRDGRKKLREKTRRIFKQFDIDGGVMIDHPYRFTEGLNSARFSPHLHSILTGWIDGQVVKEIYNKTGWIVTNVSNLESWRDCYSLSKYLLSHAAVYMKEEGKRSAEHNVRYFGECHNKKFKVQEILKHSVTGLDQLESILLERRELEKKNEIIPLQRVHYTHSIIDDDYVNSKGKESLGFIDSKKFVEDVQGNISNLSKSLRNFIDTNPNYTKDNPAIPQSEIPSMEFLQMRFSYGYTQYDIVQSVYITIIFDRSIDELCPVCTAKMQTLAPPNEEWSDSQRQRIMEFVSSLPEGETIPLQSITDFDYFRNTGISNIGIPYFEFDGSLQHETGIFQRPDCLQFLNPKLYWSTIKNIEIQKARYRFKLQNGRQPAKEELQEILNPNPKIFNTQSQKLDNFLGVEN